MSVKIDAEFHSFMTEDVTDFDDFFTIQVFQKEIFSETDMWTQKMKLPAMHLAKLTLTDRFGESTQVSEPVNVKKRPPRDLTW